MMNAETVFWSDDFKRLYCDPAVFDLFSTFHPISFGRVLPFQNENEGIDDLELIRAEEAHLAQRSDSTRLAVVSEYFRCGLLQEEEAANLRTIIDFYDADFFDLMGLLYSNAGMYRCALRWYRELIAELETQQPGTRTDVESVYASVGYCLYSLGLFEESISWSKSCIGPCQAADSINRALITYENSPSGIIRSVERAGPNTRYTISAFEPADPKQSAARLHAAMKNLVPFQQVYIDWVDHDAPLREIQPGGYPFSPEFDSGSLLKHKMILILATCARADVLVERGYCFEAKRLLYEAAMLEPDAAIVTERLRALA